MINGQVLPQQFQTGYVRHIIDLLANWHRGEVNESVDGEPKLMRNRSHYSWFELGCQKIINNIFMMGQRLRTRLSITWAIWHLSKLAYNSFKWQ